MSQELRSGMGRAPGQPLTQVLGGSGEASARGRERKGAEIVRNQAAPVPVIVSGLSALYKPEGMRAGAARWPAASGSLCHSLPASETGLL